MDNNILNEALDPKLQGRYKEIKSKSQFNEVNELFIDISDLNGLTDGQFVNRFLNYCKLGSDRNIKMVYIPVRVWADRYGEKAIEYNNRNNKNALACLLRFMINDMLKFKQSLPGFVFIFAGDVDWFAVNVDQLSNKDKTPILSNLKLFLSDHAIHGVTGTSTVVSKAPTEAKDNVESKKKAKKDKVVQKIQQVASDSTSEEEAIDKLDKDEEFKRMLTELEDDEYGAPKFTKARTDRMSDVNQKFLDSTVSGKSVKQMIEEPKKAELESTALPVHSINEEWQDVKYINFGKEYDIDKDIMKILHSFSEKDYPVVVKSVNVEDTSTNQDYIDTYTVEMEDSFGKRFTLKFDVPKFINNRFLKLRGNEKVISGQLLNLPCIKTDEDSVQLVSNYNKIFIRRYGGSGGKVFPISDRLIKALRKYNGKKLKISFGDNSQICKKYNLPIDYVDLASNINKIESDNLIYFFDQDVYYNKYNADSTQGIPFAVVKQNNEVLYYNDPLNTMSEYLANSIKSDDPTISKIYDAIKPANKHTYSRASIMSSQIPLIIVICNNLPFTEVLKRAKIKYSIEDKRVKYNPDKQEMIRFSDCYLLYDLSYESSLLLNGLKEVDTENYSFVDMNKKRTWLDFLDSFGGRILSDGLENFSQVFMDPITVEICQDMKLPTDYFDLMIYANNLLADTKYNKHTDIRGNRYRTNEIVASRVYTVLAKSYSDYRTQVKRGKKAAMTVKRTAVIDEILKNSTTSDLSSMTPLLELEAANSATFKGPSGLNTDRAYSLEKRTYDETMINKIAMSTGFSANVGINRQTTMDMDIQGVRGYIKDSDPEDKSVSKRFSATEAVTPFGATRETF